MSQELLMLVFFAIVALPGGYLLYTILFPSGLKEHPLFNSTREETKSFLPEIEIEDEKQALSSKIQKVGLRQGFSSRREQLSPLDEKLFRAGYFRDEERRTFRIIRIFAPIITGLLGCYYFFSFDPFTRTAGIALSFYLGYFLLSWYLDRIIKIRDEEIMCYLPLVIEQLVIGVSSGLDIGPCIQRVVAVADERDTHNPVTELLRNVTLLTRSGTPLDDGLEEIGTLAGHTELKHSFMTMGQVSRHGGEITKQLQELANAVSGQRETRVEARIKKLELTATGPVVLVFASFMAVLFVGIGLQVLKALSS